MVEVGKNDFQKVSYGKRLWFFAIFEDGAGRQKASHKRLGTAFILLPGGWGASEGGIDDRAVYSC
jgi:hypothetical protein